MGQGKEDFFHVLKKGRRSLIEKDVGMVMHVSFGVVHLVVSSRDGDDDRFDVKKFLFGEGSCSSTCKADVGNLVQLPHLFLTEKVEAVDVLLREKWLEIVI